MQGGQSGGMGEDLKFFVGTKEEYLDILKTSYETIKKADSDAKVLHAGMAGMQKEAVDFFEPIFSAEGGKYFDIANNHTISTDEGREDLSMIKFKDLLTIRGLGDKPVWLTEVQFGSLQEKPKDLTEFEKLMARATVFALSKGAEKLFYIENWLMWEKDEAQKEKKPTPLDKNNSTNKVYLNLVNTMNQFDKIETIKEDYVLNQRQDEGATSKIGQYKIINGSNIIYALWGKAELPSEITGKIIVTDIYGEKNETDAEKLTLSDSPVFIEIAR